MSWVLKAKIPPGADNARQTAVLDEVSVPECSVEQLAQIQAAKRTALKLLRSGALGDGPFGFMVNLSGHANPRHNPQTSDSLYDFVSIEVIAVGDGAGSKAPEDKPDVLAA